MRRNGESKPCLHVWRLILGLVVWLSIVCACGLSQEDLSRIRRNGQEAFDAGKFKLALSHWEPLLENNPRDWKAALQIGRAHLQLGELSKAVEHFTTSVEYQPDNGWGWYELGRLHLLRGEADLGLKYVARARRHLPEDPRVAILEGQIHFFLHEYAAAEQRYREALKRDPNQMQALAQLALCLAAQDQGAASARVYHDLQALDPKDSMLLMAMADYWMLGGQPERAESILLQAQNLHPGTLLFAKKLAEWYFDSDQYSAAEEQARLILEQRPDHVHARKLLAEILLADGKLEQVRPQLDRLEALISDDTEFLLLKGKYQLLAGNFSQAGSCFQTAIENLPQFPLSHYLKGIALLRQGHVHLARKSFVRTLALAPLFTQAELALASVSLYQNDLSTAQQYAERVILREPVNSRARMIQGIIRLLQMDYSGAQRSFRHAELLASEPHAARYFQAVTAVRDGQPDQALQLFREILKHKRLYTNVSRDYTRLLAANDRLAEAEAFFAGLRKITRQAGYAHTFLGIIHMIQGEPEQAEQDWLAALDSDKCPPSVYTALTDLYRTRQQPRKELDILERFLSDYPASSTAALQLAAQSYRTGQHSQAKRVLESGLRYNPDEALLLSNLAWLLLDEGAELLRALSLAQEAYSRAPEEPAVVDTLGWAYYKKKLYTRAVWHLQEARDLEPDNPRIQEHLRKAMQAGGGEEAESMGQRAEG